MRTKHRIDHRFIALFLAVMMLFTSMRMLAFVMPVVVAEGDALTIRDDAMHFFIRHWHTAEDKESVLNPGNVQDNGQGDYFVVVEGYIMPDSKNEGKYVCYAVKQGSDNTAGTLYEIGDIVENSPYVDDFDPEDGTIILKTKLLIDPTPDIDDPVERFAGISISAGHGAVTSYDEEYIVIKYNKDIHLVKGHVFYQNKSRIVTGTNDEVAFKTTGMFDNEEIDTAWVLTYNKSVGDHNEGELVMSGTQPEQVCVDLKDLPDGTSEGDVEWTKYYSTASGLHTDKTVVAQSADGRAFMYDLEAWYTEGYPAQVGLVLDASGSMAFALNKPSVINVKDLGLETKFEKKIGFVNTWNDYTKPDDLIGYYQFQPNGAGTTSATNPYRTWYLNSAKDSYTDYKTAADFNDINKKKNFAKTVKQATKEQVVSGSIDFSNSNAVWQPSDIDSVFNKTQDGWGEPMSFSGTDGMYLTNSASKSGFLLEESANDSANFTISFSLKQLSAGACSSDIEILYIGPTTVTDNSPSYFHVYRTGNDIVAEYGGNEVVNIENAYASAAVSHTITFAFGKDGLTTYLDDKAYGKPVEINGLTADVIVFDPFEDENKTEKYFSVNNVCLFNTVLEEDEVKELHQVIGGASTSVKAVQKSATAFLSEAELSLILNTHKNDNSYLGFADYSYYIYNPEDSTHAYAPITYYYSDKNVDIEYFDKRNVDRKGWYYISCASSIGEGGTSKRLSGLPNGSELYDTIEKTSTVQYGRGAAPDVENIEGNTDKNYTQSGSSPIKFYIDIEGNLRCFFAVGNNTENVYTSFVYELADEDYIRTEGLQRVLGSFANTLNDRSPSAQLSAVQFSNNTADTKGKLLLDWTSDSNRMAGILSLNKGDGTADGKNDNNEYNYAMTGGTYTDKGLQAFRTLLANKDYKHDDITENDISPRYLILFTDGEYNSDETDLFKQANILKGEAENPDGKDCDYTIFVVLLTDKEGETDKTKNLAKLSGKKGVTVDETGKGSDGKQYYFHINDLDALAHAFMTDILDQIVDDMDGYTVKDYIDPRFDLQSADGTIWHLHANGEVMKQPSGVDLEIAKKDDQNYTKGLSKTNGIEFRLSGETNPEARSPMLYYDKDEDMYYLEWKKQTIPTCGVGSDRLEEWIAQVWVRAKEDFIGGNDILVGGNTADMNWVYHPNDTDASSGTDDAERDYYNTGGVDPYRSKGFPRPVVNVQLMPLNTLPLDDVIFKGEYISHAQILTDIEDKYVTDTYYLEYLRRYAYQRYLYVLNYKEEEENKTPQNIARIAMFAAEAGELEEDLNKPLIELLNDWLGIDDVNKLEKAFSVPYMYLPSVEHNADGTIKLDPNTKRADILTNAGGEDTHQQDVIGILTYRWHQVEPGTVNDEIKDYVKDDTEQNKYSLTVEFTPLIKGDTLKDDHYLSPDGETHYYYNRTDDKWYTLDEAGKKVVTENQTAKALLDRGYTYYKPLRSYIDVDGRDHIFAHYLPIEGDENGNKSDFTKDNDDFEGLDFDFDRAEAYVNGSLITDAYYKWNSNYKPARNEKGRYYAGDLQPAPNASDPGKYGNSSEFINNDRTLESQSAYTQEIVSGGIVLELRMLIGELAEWLDIGNNAETTEKTIQAIDDLDSDYELKKSFTLEAVRSFTETDAVQNVQLARKDKNGDYLPFEDYGDTFTFTFELYYTGAELKALTMDDSGYVTVFAKMSEIECDIVEKTVQKAANGQIQVTAIKTGKTNTMHELPIGTYEFKLDNANKNVDLDNKLHFGEITYEEDVDKFADVYDCFDVLVRNGLNTTNESPLQKWKEIGIVDDAPLYVGFPEIDKSNISAYIADAVNAQDKRTVKFYIGTDKNDNENHRGELGADSYDPDCYIYDRLGIIRLSTGMTMLTIEEKGADEKTDSRESFIYRITGKTLGGEEVDLTVSVNGNSSSTIVIAPGDYTITEIHEWSWRYNNKKTYGKYDDDENVKLHEDWKIDSGDWTKASVSIRYKDDLPENTGHETFEEHKTVIYEHEHNDKVWLGGENYKDNHFAEYAMKK